jgi:uncharacterized repeat protein (TIGR01451 family)
MGERQFLSRPGWHLRYGGRCCPGQYARGKDLWLFGGDGFLAWVDPGCWVCPALSTGLFNDLWKFEPGTGNWTWVKGSNGPGDRGVHSSKGIAAESNTPGARAQAVTWTDAEGNRWLFGGYNGSTLGPMNGLWKLGSSADLVVTQSASSSPAMGLPLTYTISVQNAGPVSATGVMLADVLSSTVEFISATASPAVAVSGETLSGGVVTASIGTLAPGASFEMTITVRPSVSGLLTNTVEVFADQIEVAPADNTSILQVNVADRPAPDFSVIWSRQPVEKCRTKNTGTFCTIIGGIIFSNAGMTTRQTVLASFYLSSDAAFDAGDVLLPGEPMPIVFKSLRNTLTRKFRLKLPVNTEATGLYLLVVTDTTGVVAELRERNNTAVYGPLP